MTSKIVETKNGEIEYSLIGKGIPILFVHGGHSNCRERIFHKGFDINRFCLITPSRPGYGNTPLSNNFSPKDAATLFVALLDELKVKSAIVIGISAGGLTAIELASCYPERIEKLILISAVTKKWLKESDDAYKKGKKLFSPTLEKYSWGLFRFFYSLFPKIMAKTMFKELSTLHPSNITIDEILELQMMINEQRSFKGFTNDLDQDIEQNIIDNVLSPSLILHSSNDKVVDIEHAKYAHTKLKNSDFKIYNNKWGHLLWIGQESRMPIVDTLQFIDS